MTKQEQALIKAETLLEVADALNQGAAGPCDYWFRELAKRLTSRAQKLVEEARR